VWNLGKGAMMPIEFWVVGVLAMLVISVSKAGFGGGPGVLATPMMVAVCHPDMAIGVMLPVMIMCDVFVVVIYWRECDWKKMGVLLAGFAIGIWIADKYLLDIPGREVWLKAAIGILSIVFGTSYFIKEKLKTKYKLPWWFASIWMGLLFGTIAGITSTLAHAAGPVLTMYLVALGFEQARFMGTMVCFAFFGNWMKVPTFLNKGMITWETMSITWPLFLVVPFGIALGWWLNCKMKKNNSFTGWINAILIGIGIFLILK